MNILIVDDEPAVRQLIRRFLVHSFDAEVLEADDGLAALDRLLTGRIDLVLLDLSMPGMDGIETLEAIRRSRTYRTLPVVMITGNADESQMRRAMELGIASVIIKPFTRATLHERLTTLIASIPSAGRDTQAGPLKIDITSSHRILIVDRNPEFRATAARLFSKICQVEEADTEATALERSLSSSCDLLLVGAMGDGPSLDAFARTVRGTRGLRAVKLLAAVPAEDRAATKARGAYDAVLVRSFVPESFEYSLRQVLGDGTLTRMLLHHTSPFVAHWFESVRLHLGRLMRSEIAMCDAPPLTASAARWVVAQVELQTESGTWNLGLRCPVAIALQIGKACLDAETDHMAQSQLIEAVATVVKGFARRLRTELIESGLTTVVADAHVSVHALDAQPPWTDAIGTRRWFLTPHQEMVVIELAPLGRVLAAR